MKRFLLAAVLAVVAAPVYAADVGVSISVGDPGFYGQINIGNFPRPVIIDARPVIVYREPSYEPPEPIYLRVSRGERKHWNKHCQKYNACNQQVYFVQDKWYNEVYAPQYRERDEKWNKGRDKHSNDDNGEDQGRDDHGKGHGKGHDK